MRAELSQNKLTRTSKTGNGVRDIDLHPSISAQEVHWGPNFGLPVSLEERIPATTVERLEAFLASTPQTTGATEIGRSRISPVQGDMAAKAARARRLDSFLARPCKQERHRRIQQVEGGRDVSQRGRRRGRDRF